MNDTSTSTTSRPVCGIIMPISEIDGLAEAHWAEVQRILEGAIFDAGFDGRLVSTAADAGVIHKRIVQNLYDDEIVVCDVSGRNANVMFELGMRLTFDRPTVIVKDDATPYSFDTSVIEHVPYPRQLRFEKVVEFKTLLTTKLKETHARGKDPNYSTFLKHFGTFTTPKLETKEVGFEHFVTEQMREMKEMLRSQQAQLQAQSGAPRHAPDDAIRLGRGSAPSKSLMVTVSGIRTARGVQKLLDKTTGLDWVHSGWVVENPDGTVTLNLTLPSDASVFSIDTLDSIRSVVQSQGGEMGRVVLPN